MARRGGAGLGLAGLGTDTSSEKPPQGKAPRRAAQLGLARHGVTYSARRVEAGSRPARLGSARHKRTDTGLGYAPRCIAPLRTAWHGQQRVPTLREAPPCSARRGSARISHVASRRLATHCHARPGFRQALTDGPGLAKIAIPTRGSFAVLIKLTSSAQAFAWQGSAAQGTDQTIAQSIARRG
jgi:hypothetical protein